MVLMTAGKILILLLIGMLAGGCTGISGSNGPEGTPVPHAGPAVLITSPEFDGGVMAGNVTIVTAVEGFTITPPGGHNLPGTGHLIFYRDVAPPVTPHWPAFSVPGSYRISPGTSLTWDNISPGTHTFSVQLVSADNTPLDPPALDAVDVTAVAPGMIAGP